MSEAQTWRDFLGAFIRDPSKHQQIANALGVNPITLTRWVKGYSKPRLRHLHQLLIVFPEHRETLRELVEKDFEGFVVSPADMKGISEEIPAEFYARVLNTHAHTVASLHSWSVGGLILRQALLQLDPNRVGMVVTVLQCMPPASNGKIRSLHGGMGVGNPPWTQEWIHSPVLAGAESLSGYALTVGRQVVSQDTQADQGYFPVRYHSPWTRSAAATPIVCNTRVIGCLYVCSTQPGYFVPSRLKLLQNYAELMELAFNSEELYEAGTIELGIIPPFCVLEEAFATFQQRVVEATKESVRRQQFLTRSQVEQKVLQQIEQELLQ